MLLEVEGKKVWGLQRVQRTCEVSDVWMNNMPQKKVGRADIDRPDLSTEPEGTQTSGSQWQFLQKHRGQICSGMQAESTLDNKLQIRLFVKSQSSRQ